MDSPLHRAAEAADFWLGQAVARIDARFGEGFARTHPALVAAFVQVASETHNADRLVESAGAIAAAVGSGR